MGPDGGYPLASSELLPPADGAVAGEGSPVQLATQAARAFSRHAAAQAEADQGADALGEMEVLPIILILINVTIIIVVLSSV